MSPSKGMLPTLGCNLRRFVSRSEFVKIRAGYCGRVEVARNRAVTGECRWRSGDRNSRAKVDGLTSGSEIESAIRDGCVGSHFLRSKANVVRSRE